MKKHQYDLPGILSLFLTVVGDVTTLHADLQAHKECALTACCVQFTGGVQFTGNVMVPKEGCWRTKGIKGSLPMAIETQQ